MRAARLSHVTAEVALVCDILLCQVDCPGSAQQHLKIRRDAEMHRPLGIPTECTDNARPAFHQYHVAIGTRYHKEPIRPTSPIPPSHGMLATVTPYQIVFVGSGVTYEDSADVQFPKIVSKKHAAKARIKLRLSLTLQFQHAHFRPLRRSEVQLGNLDLKLIAEPGERTFDGGKA